MWMIALAGNFYIFAPRITARLAAVLLAARNIAAAWNVRAFLILLKHHNSSDRNCSGFSIFCSSHGLPFSCTLYRVPVAIRGSVLLSSLLQSRFHLGTTSSRGAVERLRQGSERKRARLSGTPKGTADFVVQSQTPQMQPRPPRNPTAVSSGPGSRVTLTATKSNDTLHGSKRRHFRGFLL